MANPFPRLLQELQRLNSGIRGECSVTWGARNQGFRQTIRESLCTSFADWRTADIEFLQNLKEPPRPQERSVSISHTNDLGGWMSAPRPTQIGWDVEQISRIRLPIIERICSREEIAQAPFAAALWCAKESYFKSLEDEQPLTVIQLTIDQWQQQECAELYRWRGIGPRNAQGFLFEDGPFIAAACLIP